MHELPTSFDRVPRGSNESVHGSLTDVSSSLPGWSGEDMFAYMRKVSVVNQPRVLECAAFWLC